ncbi:glycosyltransferase [Aneurinibacillus sp. Ricciae_BoGa-3]|uniref:glycosyltransferase n=1 Tax=Aneurinibacillus sp. Ricciae_BoGa-3 TaxID=3022697 RepID=UPI00234006FD|nr:glycosyltransferase [Aneurinibacillus sp. Ricciae_BoGa-3]WCK54507.1 glycosyltransferase [Aneurinibacillus sp. Ricciae_BoGa-3]
MLSIIIPTFNEKENVLAISHRIQKVLGEYSYELVFVDDSIDETPQILEQLSRQGPHVRYEHRTNERGLGTAVVRGFELAQGDTVTVMDADLQHPPEMLIPMLGAIEARADIVIPSRFIPGCDGLNIVRKVISAGTRYLGKIFLKVLRPINDPTSGYFMFKKSVINDVDLRPIGWKFSLKCWRGENTARLRKFLTGSNRGLPVNRKCLLPSSGSTSNIYLPCGRTARKITDFTGSR